MKVSWLKCREAGCGSSGRLCPLESSTFRCSFLSKRYFPRAVEGGFRLFDIFIFLKIIFVIIIILASTIIKIMLSENDIMVCTMAYFLLLPPNCLLSSLVLSVFCLANRSFVPLSLYCYSNMIWQRFCNLKQPPVQGAGAEKTQRQRRRRRRRGKRMRKRK